MHTASQTFSHKRLLAVPSGLDISAVHVLYPFETNSWSTERAGVWDRSFDELIQKKSVHFRDRNSRADVNQIGGCPAQHR